MILIADSGSTKTEWVLLHNQSVVAEIYTQGINPYFQTPEQIAQVIKEELLPQLTITYAAEIKAIYYYGAGCSSHEKCELIRMLLMLTFANAAIEVDHDLLAAARAACGNQQGIAAILGTGSNSCVFDGKHILANQPSLGFILGDEGSGGHIGKELLKQFLYNELPKELHDLFAAEFNLTKEMVLEQVYKKPMPNRYAASFVPFVSRHINHEAMRQLVSNSFSEFFKRHITSYKNASSYSLSAVGSVAFVFSQQLREVAANYNITINQIIQKPMDGLIHYHNKL